MLKVPEKEQSGTKQTEIPVPCFRCLFDKPISEGWCYPETCEMLDAWLTDKDFSWDNYVLKWLLSLERENVKRTHLKEDE